jgi:hypothetical protein
LLGLWSTCCDRYNHLGWRAFVNFVIELS